MSHSTGVLLLKHPKQQLRLGTQFTGTQRVFFPSQVNPAFLNRASEKVFAHKNSTHLLGSSSDVVSCVKPFFSFQPESVFSHDICPGLDCGIYPVLSWTICIAVLFPVLGSKLLGWLVSFSWGWQERGFHNQLLSKSLKRKELRDCAIP